MHHFREFSTFGRGYQTQKSAKNTCGGRLFPFGSMVYGARRANRFDPSEGRFSARPCAVFGVCAPFLPCFAGRGFRKRFDPKFRKRFDPNSADFAGGKNRRSGDCCGRFLSFRIHGGLSRAWG